MVAHKLVMAPHYQFIESNGGETNALIMILNEIPPSTTSLCNFLFERTFDDSSKNSYSTTHLFVSGNADNFADIPVAYPKTYVDDAIPGPQGYRKPD